MALPTYNEEREQNTILATTTADVSPEITNNAVNAHPLVAILTGRVNDDMFGSMPMSGAFHREKTGESIECRVKLGKSSAWKMLNSGYEEFSRDTQDTARVLRANWRLGGGTAILSGFERRNNAGMARIADLWQYKLEESIEAGVDDVASQVFSGSGSAEVTGLDTVIDANDNSFQGIGGDSYENWNSRGLSAKGTAASAISFGGGSFARTGVANWILAWMNASEGAIQPDITVTTEDICRFYEGALSPQVRFSGVNSADGKFRSLTFHGKPVIADSYATSGVTYFLNGRYLYMATAPGANFDTTPAMDQQFQDVFSAKTLFQGNVVCSSRKFQNKVTGQTA